VCLIFFLYSGKAFADTTSRGTVFKELYDTLNKETDLIYTPYGEFSEKLSSAEEPLYNEFQSRVLAWRAEFVSASNIYYKHSQSVDQQISEIASIAYGGSQKGVQSCDAYLAAIRASDTTTMSGYLDRGDQLMTEAIAVHENAADLYNNYSGATDAYNIRDWLLVGSGIFALFSFFLFLKSRRKSSFQAEVARSGVYGNLFRNSLWVTIGLVVTTVGYSYALGSGGTYYILYGPIFFGGWRLLSGLYDYFKNGRPLLNQISQNEKGDAIKQSYLETTQNNITESTPSSKKKRCNNCRNLVPANSIMCPNCGNNVL